MLSGLVVGAAGDAAAGVGVVRSCAAAGRVLLSRVPRGPGSGLSLRALVRLRLRPQRRLSAPCAVYVLGNAFSRVLLFLYAAVLLLILASDVVVESFFSRHVPVAVLILLVMIADPCVGRGGRVPLLPARPVRGVDPCGDDDFW